MSASIVVGVQWGDEGKGRIIDLLAEQADYIIRFQGGSNAGHTLIDNRNQKVVLHQIPSGILRDDKICVIGSGVVIDPVKLVGEIDALKKLGYLKNNSQLVIADGCQLVMPYHQQLDLLEEKARGDQKIGTTGKGIGPAYTDKVGRLGVRLCDLADPQRFRDKLRLIVPHKNQLLEKLYGQSGISEEVITAPYLTCAEKLRPYIQQVPYLLDQALRQGKNLLLEGAQGSELDIDHGTYPFVTSSNTLASAACIGAGISPRSVGRVIGIVKAYTTRVGSGPFPTEDKGELGEQLCQKGNEFGSTTGRKRRCGWLDIPQLKHAIMLNGIDTLILTKLDILSGFKQIPVCVAYRRQGEKLTTLPTSVDDLHQCEPVYEASPGWTMTSNTITEFSDLPPAALNYVRHIETLLECPIALASIGPKRENFLTAGKKNFAPFLTSAV